ncbi:MAG: hypothetical protein ACLVKR_00570 [Lachnospiraceae bacterium]
MNKKVLTFVLAVVMVMSLMVVPAFAADGNVASIGEDEFPTVQAAIDSVTGSEEVTIKLIDNSTESITIPAEKNITLDLGTFTLTNEANKHTITNNGSLTITGKGTVDNVSHAKGAIVNNGNLVVEDGTFTRSKEAGSSPSNNGGNSWYVVDNHGTMTVKDGTIKSTSFYSSLLRNIGGKLVVEGGNFSNNFIALKNDDEGEMIISGGVIKTTAAGGSALQNWGDAQVVGGQLEAVDGAAAIYASAWDDRYTSTTTVSDEALVMGDVKVTHDTNYPESTSTASFVMTGGIVTGNIAASEISNVQLKNGLVGGSVSAAGDAKLLISGGAYGVKPDVKYIDPSVIAAEVYEKESDIKMTFIGTNEQMQMVIDAAVAGDKFEFFSGDVNVNVKTEGVTISNTGNGNVTLNGEKVETDEEVIVHTHKAVKVDAKDATCTEAGNIAYWYCEGCQKYFSDEALTKEISKEDTVIDALGHEWEDHFTVDKQATAKEDGSKSIHCKHCDAVKEVTVIPATGAANNGDDTPKTGDNNLIALYIGLVVLAAACLTATLALRKRSTK